MIYLWVVIFTALTGSHLGDGLPIGTTPQTYPHDHSGADDAFHEGWWSGQPLYTAVPALALVITAGLLLGCMWCYRHKDNKTSQETRDVKQNQGTDNQLFSTSAVRLHNERRPPSPAPGLSEPANNNVSEDNNNGPISLREMQNIANNNAAAYIVSDNEERNRAASRESVVQFEPLPEQLGAAADPLQRCADWLGADDFPRDRLQYLREIGRGWFGRVVEGELEGEHSPVAVKILNPQATPEDKARFLDEAKMYRDLRHEHLLAYVARCLQDDPWILLFELYSMDLQQYLAVNRPKMASLNEAGVPLRLQCDVTSALAYLHARGYVYGNLWSGNVLLRGDGEGARAVLGRYTDAPAPAPAPQHIDIHTTSTEVWSLGALLWEVCSWEPAGAPPPLPEPALPCPYRAHLYQVMQLCWSEPDARPAVAQVHALLAHLLTSLRAPPAADADEFEARWQRLKPNSIPKLDEHVAIVHAPSTSTQDHFTGSEHELDTSGTMPESPSAELSRCSSAHAHAQGSLTNLHGSLDDVRLQHDLTDLPDPPDQPLDTWLKDIVAGSQDDVSYYRDVSDVIKNLDNILNSEKTSSSESSHQASPSRDNLSLDCNREPPPQSGLVKSPGISNFQNLLDGCSQEDLEDEVDRDTAGTLSHSYERHSDASSQHTLAELTPDTPLRDIADFVSDLEKRMRPSGEARYIVGNNEAVCEATDELVGNNEAVCEAADELVGNNEAVCEAADELVGNNEAVCKATDELVGNIEALCQATGELLGNTEAVCEASDELVGNNEAICEATDELLGNNEVACEATDELVGNNETVYEARDELLAINEAACEASDELLGNNEAVSEATDELVGNNEAVYEARDELLANNEAVREASEELVGNNKAASEKPAKVAISSKDVPKLRELCLDRPRISKVKEQLSERTDTHKSIEQIINHHPEIVTRVEQVINEPRVIEIPQKCIKDCENFLYNELEHCQSEKTIASEEICKTCNVVLDLDPILTANADSQHEESSLSNHINGDNKLVEQSQGAFDNPEDEYVLFEDKHESGADALVDAVNEHTHSQNSHELSSAVDLVPHSLESNDMPLEALEELKDFSESLETHSMDTQSTLPLETPDVIVQTQPSNDKEDICTKLEDKVQDILSNDVLDQELSIHAVCDESTVYMDLINDTNSENVNKINSLDNNMRGMPSSVTPSTETTECEPQNESTVYMDLPSVITETHKLLHAERFVSGQEVVHDSFKSDIPGSTPKSNDTDSTVVDEPNTPDYGPGVTLTRLEQKFVPDFLSPFESPTKSHPTDTYDENSSVVLGPFENCTELFKGLKSATGFAEIDVPKEELLAFSSNFSDINLETPSPLRDGNFLNEVPDIEVVLQFDDINTISDPDTLENTEVSAPTNLKGGPSTPPNSPGTFLASTSKYRHDDEEIPPPPEPHLNQEIDLSQIALQMTSKLAMAENENNLNIEYSGPLTVEGLVTESSEMLRERDSVSEAVLAGSGLSEMGDSIVFDAASIAALRNELELKLPLAQVSSIEPSDEAPAWEPPELVVNYPGALSPIMEETGHQLSAYENDRVWMTSARTDSSSSYLDPCNNSTDEVTELPTATGTGTAAASGAPDLTYTVNSENSEGDADNTYTIQRDITTSRDATMSADSLNIAKDDTKSPIHDRTYTKDDEKESHCERISQESPFLVSPTTEASVPVHTDAGVSTLSKTSVPTDAKASKPAETQCLSKATSIDSWCSNDTLFNVEDNFDDLAMEGEAAADDEHHSHSTGTLTHRDDDKDDSNCSTYIVHDSKSEIETFSPDAVTENCTYTKVRTDAEKTPEAVTDHNDSSTKNTTKDLAYGTMASGYSFSNCTTELLSTNEDAWRLPQPELVRRSPVADLIDVTPPFGEAKEDSLVQESPKLDAARIDKMESVEVTCLEDNLTDSNDERFTQEGNREETQNLTPDNADVSRDFHYRNMANSVQSTPRESVLETETIVTSPLQLPNVDERPNSFNVPNYESFVNSAEARQQVSQDTGLLLEAESRFSMPSQISEEVTPTYSEFEVSAAAQPQQIHLKSPSQEFQDFENSARNRPQDISDIQNICSMLIQSERSYDMSSINSDFDRTVPSALNERLNLTNNNACVITSPVETSDLHTPIASVNFSLEVPRVVEPNMSVEDDEQPHSMIITESPCIKKSAYLTYDSHTEAVSIDFNNTYDSHEHQDKNSAGKPRRSMDDSGRPRVNGEVLVQAVEDISAIDQQIIETPLDQQTRAEIKTATSEVTPDLKGPVVLETELQHSPSNDVQCNGSGAKYATVNFINESFEELFENVDTDKRKTEPELENESSQKQTDVQNMEVNGDDKREIPSVTDTNGEAHQSEVNRNDGQGEGVTSVTETFLQNEKQFCQFDRYLPLMNDIRFTGPTSEIMSTSFSIESPTEPSPRSEVSRSEPNGHSGNSGPDVAADIMKEWDSDSDDSQSSNPSSGEFIWKQRGGPTHRPPPAQSDGGSDAGSGSGSGSGSEGDEVEFVPSSWDCRAAPAKSSLRLAEQAEPLHHEGKKRVVFKRQKYHCVYEYPRELADVACEALSARGDQLPDYSTYSDWASTAHDEAELSYGQLYGGHPFDMSYPLRAALPFGSDYDEDFFISSSAHPFESLGVMSSSSQFFPGMRLQALKCAPPDELCAPPAPPAPPAPAPPPPPPPELGFTTPDSGVEDVTPGELDGCFAEKQEATCWRAPDSAGSSESASPSSPGGGCVGGALGGLRHTRDKLKLDLPPSPCTPTPRHGRAFSFALDKPPPPRRAPAAPASPPAASALPVSDVDDDDDVAPPEPTFSTFGKPLRAADVEQQPPRVCAAPAPPECAESAGDAAGSAAADEASGDEDSGIESSARTTLERSKDTPTAAPAAPRHQNL